MNQREKEHTIVDIKIDEFEKLDRIITNINKQFDIDITMLKSDRKKAIKRVKDKTKETIKTRIGDFKEQQTAKAESIMQEAKNKEA